MVFPHMHIMYFDHSHPCIASFYPPPLPLFPFHSVSLVVPTVFMTLIFLFCSPPKKKTFTNERKQDTCLCWTGLFHLM
jgi:hypothetical protein